MRRSAFVHFSLISRIAASTLVFAGLLVLAGCWVYSVHPLYEENLAKPDPDLFFDQALLGSWWIADDDCPGILTIAAREQAYTLSTAPSAQCKGDKKTSQYEGHLVKLDNHVFLDIAPALGEVCDLCLPLRSFFLVQIEKNSLALVPINYEWLNNSIKQKTVMLETLPNPPSEILVASSKELKAFMRKYADDNSVFQPSDKLTFKRK